MLHFKAFSQFRACEALVGREILARQGYGFVRWKEAWDRDLCPLLVESTEILDTIVPDKGYSQNICRVSECRTQYSAYRMLVVVSRERL